MDLFCNGEDVLLRFYDGTREHRESEIVNLVIVDPGYGFLCLKIKGDCGLISGCLDESVFTSEKMIESAVDFLKNLAPRINDGYVPFHVQRVKTIDYVEYNGEY